MSDEYYAGKDCRCFAEAPNECNCGVDWTDPEVYELRKQLAESVPKSELQKLLELTSSGFPNSRKLIIRNLKDLLTPPAKEDE